MVDAERLHRLLRRVTDDVAVLRAYSRADPDDLRRDPVRLGHITYTFVTLLEACLDAAHHVCAARGYGPVDSNADAMLLLGRHGVLDEAEARKLAEASRFRNVLVHGYAQVDDMRVIGYLQRLQDLDGYVDRLSRLL